MKRHGIYSTMESSYDKRLLFTIYVIGLIICNSMVNSYPSWDSQNTLSGECLNNSKNYLIGLYKQKKDDNNTFLCGYFNLHSVLTIAIVPYINYYNYSI